MTIQKQPVDVVIVGMGWAGSIVAKELSDAGLTVVGLERGALRTQSETFSTPRMFDELPFNIRNALAMDLSRETITFRNSSTEIALPMRQIGSFNPGSGTGGSGVTWSGHTFRNLPSDLSLHSHIRDRYGSNFMPEGMTIQDWGVTYEELEPYYDKFEAVAGTSGKAGNLKGKIQAGGNPFEGVRSREYANPALPRTYAGELFAKAAKSLGYSPFPVPVSNSSRAYKNPYGVELGECRICGHCTNFACTYSAKASAVTTILPALLTSKTFELRTNAYVVRVNLDQARQRTTSVTYIDAAGREVEQPAKLVFLTAFAYNNARIMLLSGIGKPYNPKTGEGVIGRNYAYQTLSNAIAFFDNKTLNPYVAAGGTATVIDDFNGDNFDHSKLGFIGGGFIGSFIAGGMPISYRPTPPRTPAWGSGWKKAVVESYQSATGLNIHAACQSYRGNYLDLDPTYKDAWGFPLLRLTFDFTENEHKMSDYITDKALEIAQAMGAKQVLPLRRTGHYDITKYQTTHNTGGTAMGTDPKTSAVNRYLQSWDVHNLFIVGSTVFPQNTGYNPTGTVGALAYWAVDAIKNRYLKQPGFLA